MRALRPSTQSHHFFGRTLFIDSLRQQKQKYKQSNIQRFLKNFLLPLMSLPWLRGAVRGRLLAQRAECEGG